MAYPPHASAVVLGASMGGLLAARALSPHVARVTVVERDYLENGPTLRKGVPQAAHAHGLLASGYGVIDSYFPGLMDELHQCGAPHGDVVGDFLWFQYGRWKLRHDAGLRGIVVSRPCLESAIRRHVRALPNVTILDGTTAVRPIYDEALRRVRGLVVRGRERQVDETMTADLVVDASGRGSQAPAWLDSWGYERPDTALIRIDLGYATRMFERRPGDFFNSVGAVIAGTPPESTRYCAVLAAEGDRWVITLAGTLGDHPPTDMAGWLAFAATLPVADVYQLAVSAKPIGEPARYHFPANQRRLYEQMSRFPEGFVVFGDALCSFNPLYGQGMSTAAMEARALEQTVAIGLDRVGPRFFARAKKVVDTAWTIAAGEDLKYPEVEGPRPPGTGLINRYLERVHAIASVDPVVCSRFFNVLNLLEPAPALMSPSIAWRVLSRRKPASMGSPWGVKTR